MIILDFFRENRIGNILDVEISLNGDSISVTTKNETYKKSCHTWFSSIDAFKNYLKKNEVYYYYNKPIK